MWLKRLNRAWRLFGTGFCFFAFGLGGLIFGIVVFPLIFVFIRNPNTRKGIARRFVSNSFKLFMAIMSGLGVLSYEIKGSENAVIGHNQIIIANHPMLIDVVFLVTCSRWQIASLKRPLPRIHLCAVLFRPQTTYPVEILEYS